MRGVSGSCGLALPNIEENFVSHNPLQPLVQGVGDLRAVLVNQAAAAMTSASPAAVSFFSVLYQLSALGGKSQPKTSSPQNVGSLFCNV